LIGFFALNSLSPTITVSGGNLVQIHLINEEKNQYRNPPKHNLNIDEFNVYTKDRSYFKTESIIFLADKMGALILLLYSFRDARYFTLEI